MGVRSVAPGEDLRADPATGAGVEESLVLSDAVTAAGVARAEGVHEDDPRVVGRQAVERRAGLQSL
jgi:hypothetical protein